MKLTGYKIKNRKSLGIFAAAVVVGMFVIRGILLGSGTIDEMYTLDADALRTALEDCEVQVLAVSPDGETASAGGTILDGRKLSTGDEEYTLTLVTALSAAGTGTEEKTLTVTLPDGSQAEGTIIAWNVEDGFCLVQCRYPEELEVYYSRDILYRLDEEEPLYVLADGAVTGGDGARTGVDVEDLGEDLIQGCLETDGASVPAGSGLYGKSGNYLGMVLRCEEDGTVYAVPGDVIMSALDAAL